MIANKVNININKYKYKYNWNKHYNIKHVLKSIMYKNPFHFPTKP